MKKRRLLVLLALAATLVPTTSCRKTTQQQENKAAETLSERFLKLPNGLQVELLEGACGEQAAIVVLFPVGIDHDPPGRSGMTHLVAHLLSTSGATAQPARVVETGSDHTTYSLVVPRARLVEELDHVAAKLSRLGLTEAEFATGRTQVLEQLAKLQGADAQLTAMSYAAEAVQPTRGNGRRNGVPAEVEQIDLAALEAFWHAHFKPGTARLIVTGRFDAEKIRGHIESAFGALPAGTPAVARQPANSTVTGTLVMGDAPSALAVAVPAPSVTEPLYPAFLVQAARLMEKPQQGRTWEASYDPLSRPETLFITGPLPASEQPDPAASRIRGEVTAILNRPLAPGDVAAARDRFRLLLGLDHLAPATCTQDPRALAVARARRAQLGLRDIALAQALETTTKEQLDEAAQLFGPKRTAAVIAGGTIR